MRKKWANRLVLAYLPAFILVIAVLSGIFFVTISQTSREQAVQSNEIYAENTMQYIDAKLRTVEQYMVRTFMEDRSVSDFYSETPATANHYLNDRDVYAKLNLLRKSFDEIDSVYLYRARDHVVLSDASMLGLDQFDNRVYLEKLLSAPPGFRWTIGADYVNEAGLPTPVVSLVKPMPLPLGTDGIMVVNIRTDALGAFLSDVARSKFSYVRLVDADGAYIAGDTAEERENGGEHQDMTVMRSGYTGWTIHSGFVDGVVFRFFANVNGFSVLLGLATVVAGMLWIIYASQQHYRPIQSLLERLSAVPLQKPHILGQVKRDEFKIIDNMLDHLLEQFGKYRIENDENYTYRRRYLFEELIMGAQTGHPGEWEKELWRLGFQNASGHYRAGIIEIDKYTAFISAYNNKDQYLIKFIIDNVVQELCKTAGVPLCLEWLEPHRLCIVCQLPEDENESVHNILRKTVEWVGQNLAITVTCGLGTKVPGMPGISLSYSEALEALDYKSAYGANSVIAYTEIDNRSGEELFRSLPHIRELVHAYKLGREEWRDSYRHLFGEIRIQLFSREQLVNLMNYLLFHFYKEMSGLSEDYLECWREYAMNPISDLLSRFDTVEELERELQCILEPVALKLRGIREQRSQHDLVDEVKRYMEQEYHNPDFSLVMLSDKFKLTPNYLSRLFKEEFGVKFIDYLAELRIGQAQRLLLTTQAPVQEIGERVGYTHTFSFIRVFKKRVGFTPGEYRKEHGDHRERHDGRLNQEQQPKR
ncbi:MAG: transcriptional regulator, AraC family [Paenibacillaceae bacterium]|nr:transcriptional regulator, AraC family [Paenibacillaceae bacterium]